MYNLKNMHVYSITCKICIILKIIHMAVHASPYNSLRYRGGFIFGGEVKGQRWRSARGWEVEES